MIDICTVVHNTDVLAHWQASHWAMFPKARLIMADNTRGKPIMVPGVKYIRISEVVTGDGASHGHALDAAVQEAETEIIGTVDSDFFWLVPDIIEKVEAEFATGKVCVGCEGWYDDWHLVDKKWPARAGKLAPVCWGMFVRRDLALSETFVVTEHEGSMIMETGWRLRQKLIEKKHPVTVLKAFQMAFPWIADDKSREAAEASWFFGPSECEPWGVHFVKGSGRRSRLIGSLKVVVDHFVAKWR